MNADLNSLLCTDLAIWPSLDGPMPVSNSIVGSPTLKANFINRLLLYDQLVIPTGHLLIVPMLRLWLGDRAFRRVISEEIVVLSRYSDWFGYVGNGGGLQSFKIGPDDMSRVDEHSLASLVYAPLDQVVSYMLRTDNPPTSDFERPALERLLLEKIRPFDLARQWARLRHETYVDILKSPQLRSFFAIRNTDLDRLYGIEPAEVVVENFHQPGDRKWPEIAAVLRIAFENVLLALASETATSLQADTRAETVLKAKGERLGLGGPTLDGFLSVSDLQGVPNVGSLFVSGGLDLDAVLRIRETRATADLRKWLRKADPLHSSEVLRAYVAGLGQKAVIERLPVKTLRFVATTLLGKIPGLGEVASFVDSFLLERWFPGSSPYLLFDGFRTVVLEERKGFAKTAGRNSPCSCGSGKKFKKCCGQ